MQVTVPPEWVDVCRKYSKEAERAGGRMAYGGRVNKEAAQFFTSKIAEVALAYFLGEDPNYAVKWVIGKFDDGYDVMDKLGRRFDVKSTMNSRARFLMWGAAKTQYYNQSDFDALVFCIVDPYNSGKLGQEVDLIGFETKEGFLKCCKIATGLDPIQEGTWYMDRDDLKPIECLLE